LHLRLERRHREILDAGDDRDAGDSGVFRQDCFFIDFGFLAQETGKAQSFQRFDEPFPAGARKRMAGAAASSLPR
jgi:hypothetical protein